MQRVTSYIESVEDGYWALLYAIFYSSPIDEVSIGFKIQHMDTWSGVYVNHETQKAHVIKIVDGEVIYHY